MQRIDVIVIGGGQAGLAISRSLRERAIQHVVLERGRIAERWRNASWDSLRLLTPNWMTRLPGYRYQGSDPDGFMHKDDVIRLLTNYSFSFYAPIETRTEVTSLAREGDRYRVVTNRGVWLARAVVIATGHCQVPLLPALARSIPGDVRQIASSDYRNPDMLQDGSVLVVGASASGVQIADEIRRSGRPVTLSAGRHTRLPRRYRGRDIMWWLDRIGVLDERADSVPDLDWARRQPSLQLVGDDRDMSLPALAARGVEIVGRTVSAERGIARFSSDLEANVSSSERTLARLTARIDDFIRRTGLRAEPDPGSSAPQVRAGREQIFLGRGGIETVIWATGFAPSYPWLKLPVLDRCGEIVHLDGVTAMPGLYAIGLRFLRTRKSSFIDGVGGDAQAIAGHLSMFLHQRQPMAA